MKTSKVVLISLGCPRNLVDSEIMLGFLKEQGYQLIQEVNIADVIIINTCGFLQSAREESLEAINQAIKNKKKGAKVIVTGCMAQLDMKELKELDVHASLGAGEIDHICSVISNPSSSKCNQEKSFLETPTTPRLLSTLPHYAYVKIAEGCKKHCSYCIIPHIKGPLKSKPKEQIIHEITSLLDQRVWEIILIAQDLGDWGRDFGYKGSQGLNELLQEIANIPHDFRIRLLYLYPDEIDDDLIQTLQSHDKILPYIDMPIQHINDTILKKMKRSTSKNDISTIIKNLKQAIPHISLRTSLMVGFPGETQEQFDELHNFVNDHPFEHVGIFTYSQEELSSSATLPNQILESVKKERCEKLLNSQKELSMKKNREMIGKTVPVLIDSYHPESNLLLIGRLPGQCPEVDSTVLINDFENVHSFGETYLVEITDLSEYDLIGKVLTPCSRDLWK